MTGGQSSFSSVNVMWTLDSLASALHSLSQSCEADAFYSTFYDVVLGFSSIAMIAVIGANVAVVAFLDVGRLALNRR